MGRSLSALLLLLPALALGAIGTVTTLEGEGTRTTARGETSPLAKGTRVEVGDTLRIAADAGLKLTLTDGSVLMLGSESELVLSEARFKGLEREGFSAKLLFGKAWAKVTQALSGSDAKFEITTERAVAGVRGTIFRVDASTLIAAANPDVTDELRRKKQQKRRDEARDTRGAARDKKRVATRASVTRVRVTEGRVAVSARVRKPAPKSPEKSNDEADDEPAQKGFYDQEGPRKQVGKPGQISRGEWEEKFVELQRNQEVRVGEELWQEATFRPEERDDFDRFVARHD